MQRKCNLSFNLRLNIEAEKLNIPDDLDINDSDDVSRWLRRNLDVDISEGYRSLTFSDWEFFVHYTEEEEP